MTDQEREEFEFRLRLEQEAEGEKGLLDRAEEMTGVDVSSPLFGGAIGAVAGIPAGALIEGATRGAMAPLPKPGMGGVPGGGTGGEKWARNWAGMNKPGASVPEAAAAYQRAKGHGPVTAKVTQKFGPGAKLDIASYSQAQKARPLAEKIIGRAPPAVQRTGQAVAGAASKIPKWLGRGVAGASAGFQGVDAVNRWKTGDKLGGVIGGLGAVGSGAALIPHPLTRGIGTAIGVGAPMLNELIDRYRNKEEPRGYAKGRAVTGGLGLIGKDVPNVTSSSLMQTVKDPRRMSFPGIYERPDLIAERAVKNTAPESPLLKQLFGVTRDDLYEMSKRKGNVPGLIPGAAKNPKGSAAAEAVMTPRNEQRLLDIMSELQTRAPEMYRGMHGWYTMDPMYQRLVQIAGPDEAKRLYDRLNTFGGIESPNMPVPNEFRRASAAHMMAEQGRFPDWQKYGGLSAIEKAAMPDYPADLLTVPGRVGHQRAATSQGKYLETGQHGMDSPKAPPYIQASSVPELGFQTDIPVGDAHWSRGIGLADVRTGKSTAESVSTPEIQQLAPWWRDRIAGQMGTESVPAQAILWGGLGPATGVKTAVGAPKLELKAIEIGNAAKRLGISPEEARDLILLGKERAGKRAGGMV